ncbi:hypothetical protein [Marinobacter sp. MDS2]|uniref:hypothetical protein n=1 Tax=Marinobacter sp. MDS2 TaxID=3065961 RepID=UPI00273B0E8D|nr:hypothetical protein [Marinobacter sp. MDS2]MDP4546486.1 hypothetical protein [Marinobacter sp. MDS2]
MTQDELIDQVLLDIPGAPRATVRDQLKRMARELCQAADAWVHRGYVVVAARSHYPQLIVPEGAEPLRIRSLKAGDRVLRLGADYRQPEPGRVEMLRQPDRDSLTGELACRPTTTEPLPESLLNDWADPIGNGARWRLLMMPQPWKDPALAAHYHTQYRAGVHDAKQAATLGHARGGARVRPRPFI